MKTLKLLGIVALSALIVFWAVGCELPEDQETEGILTITTTINGAYIGEVLTATYSGSDVDVYNATYQWYREEGGEYFETFTGGDESTGRQQTYKPTETGKYQVDMFAEGFLAKRAQTFVDVQARPDYFDLFWGPGIENGWIMRSADNGQWKADSNSTTSFTDEKVVIANKTSFKLTSSFIGYQVAKNYLDLGIDKDIVDKFDLTATTQEYIEFTITNWEPILTTATGFPTGFTKGYKVTVDPSKTKSKGYSAINDTYFNIFYKPSGTVGSSKDAPVFIWQRGNTANTWYSYGNNETNRRQYVPFKDMVE